MGLQAHISDVNQQNMANTYINQNITTSSQMT